MPLICKNKKLQMERPGTVVMKEQSKLQKSLPENLFCSF